MGKRTPSTFPESGVVSDTNPKGLPIPSDDEVIEQLGQPRDEVMENLARLGIAQPEEIEVDLTPREDIADLETVVVSGNLSGVDAIQPISIAPEAVIKADVGINPKDAIGQAKVNPALVPPAAILNEAAAMMDGAQKYGPYNWRQNKVQMMVYIAAAQRHLMQLLDGEDYDPISHVHHAGHARACLGIILDAFETGNLVDDRPVKGAAGDMIRGFDPTTRFAPKV